MEASLSLAGGLAQRQDAPIQRAEHIKSFEAEALITSAVLVEARRVPRLVAVSGERDGAARR
jgi:hypothetical protein